MNSSSSSEEFDTGHSQKQLVDNVDFGSDAVWPFRFSCEVPGRKPLEKPLGCYNLYQGSAPGLKDKKKTALRTFLPRFESSSAEPENLVHQWQALKKKWGGVGRRRH